MSRIAIIAALSIASGCASMCDSSYDCDFHAFGGMRDRIDRKNGRVGSVFDPATALPSVVPPPVVLDAGGDPSNALDTDSTSASDESSGDSGAELDLRSRLLDQLDKLDALPTIPGGPDADQPLDDSVDDQSPEV